MAKKVNGAKRRFTFVDIILVLAMLGLVIFAIYSISSADKNIADDKVVQVEYQIKIEKVRYQDFSIELLSDNKIKSDFLKKDEIVYLLENSEEIGKVVRVEYEPYTESTGEINELGELIYAEYPGYINLLITVSAEAEKQENGNAVSKKVLLLGDEIEFRTKTYDGAATITQITEKGDEQ